MVDLPGISAAKTKTSMLIHRRIKKENGRDPQEADLSDLSVKEALMCVLQIRVLLTCNHTYVQLSVKQQPGVRVRAKVEIK